MMHPTDRFTGKAASYAEGRPHYPPAVIDLLAQEMHRENPRVADMGSGTGILSRAMLERGWTVYGVEPNDDMRREAERSLKDFSAFHSVAGTAEHTSLASATVDMVTAAQAFHWFDAAGFKRECSCILTPEGRVALIWNSRLEGSSIVQAEGDIHRRYCPRFYGFSGGLADLSDRIGEFFDHHFQMFRFPNDLSYAREQYLRRMMSTSYALTEKEEQCTSWLEALNGLFDRFEAEGRVTVPNETVVYLGSCRG